MTLGRAPWGFYKPALEFKSGTTVSYPYGLPVEARIERAPVIFVDGRRVNNAFVITPAGLQFGGSGADLWVEFSEDDAAAYGKSPEDFRAVALRYPSDYGLTLEAVMPAILLPNQSPPVAIRIENGRQIYGIRVTGFSATEAVAYGAVPLNYVPVAVSRFQAE